MRAKLNLTRADRLGYVVGGVALIVWALRRPSLGRTSAAGVGGWLLYQAYTGSNPMFRPLGIEVNSQPAEPGAGDTIVVEEAITISRPRKEVYAFFLNTGNLPSLQESDVEITREQGVEELAWRGFRGAKLSHFGSARLREAPGGRGTIVSVHLEYVPVGGSLGTALARMMGQSPQRLVAESLRRARQLLETGVLATTEGQPAGRR